jgi:hypothetical protein
MAQNRKYMQSTCEICNKIFTHRADHLNRFCSFECVGINRTNEKRRHGICPICGKEFRLKRMSTKYCSNKCSSLSRTTRKQIKCSYCEKEIIRPQCHIRDINYCSKECQGKYISKNKIGKNSIRWKGGISNSSGYISIRTNKGGYKQQHRTVMENFIGRKLSSNELIHHIDQNKKNNSIENLMIVTRSEHAAIHDKLLHEWRSKKC